MPISLLRESPVGGDGGALGRGGSIGSGVRGRGAGSLRRAPSQDHRDPSHQRAPRISGIEATFKDGDLWLGMMPGSLKARDLQRDERMALHSASVDPDDDEPSAWPGDAKISGRAVEVTDRAPLASFGPMPDESHVFRVDIDEVVTTRVGAPADHLVIQLWREGEELKRVTRT